MAYDFFLDFIEMKTNKRHSQTHKKNNTKNKNRQITWRIVPPNVCGYVYYYVCLVSFVLLFPIAAGTIVYVHIDNKLVTL